MITKKQYNYLSKQETHLIESKTHSLMGVYKADVEYCKVIYNELGFEGPCMTCKREVIAMYEQLAKLYFEYKAAKIDIKNNSDTNGKED